MYLNPLLLPELPSLFLLPQSLHEKDYSRSFLAGFCRIRLDLINVLANPYLLSPTYRFHFLSFVLLQKTPIFRVHH